MKRREILKGMSAAALLPFAGSADAAASDGHDRSSARSPGADKIELGNAYFLSKTNPIATSDQRDLEALALSLVGSPTIVQARGRAERRWKIMAGPNIPAEAWRDFDAKMDEWVLHYLLLGLNGDPHYPKVLSSGYGPPHEWFGKKVPGCRGPGTAENTDTNYSFIPIDSQSWYELRGKRLDPPTSYCPFHLVSTLSMDMNVASLDWPAVQVEPDGSFVVTIDPDPANGRPNHLQTATDVRYLFIRDRRVDWRDVPNAFTIRRLGPTMRPPLTVEERTALGARFIVEDISENFWFHRMVASVDQNTVSEPEVTTFFGGMAVQKLARSRLKLADDEAYVVTLQPGGSQYWLLVVYDYWLMSGDYWNRQSTLNNTQSVANPDGSYSYVFSLKDPGVHNWLDMLDLHEPLFMVRWDRLPTGAGGLAGGNPAVSGRVVKLKDLDGALPAGTKRVTPEERRKQLAERRALFDLRYVV